MEKKSSFFLIPSRERVVLRGGGGGKAKARDQAPRPWEDHLTYRDPFVRLQRAPGSGLHRPGGWRVTPPTVGKMTLLWCVFTTRLGCICHQGAWGAKGEGRS